MSSPCLLGKDSPGKSKSLDQSGYTAGVQPIHASTITQTRASGGACPEHIQGQGGRGGIWLLSCLPCLGRTEKEEEMLVGSSGGSYRGGE